MGEDQKIILTQIINNTKMLILGMKAFVFFKNYGSVARIPNGKWQTFEYDLYQLVEDYKKIWVSVNRPGGLEQSAQKLTRIIKMRK